MIIVVYMLLAMLIASICLLVSAGSFLVRNEKKKEEPRPAKLTFDGPDPWDAHLTVAHLLREDKRRKKNRRAKRVIIR